MFEALLMAVLVAGEDAARVKEPDRVGQIVIVGNKVTSQGPILDRLGLYPGQVLTADAVRAAGWRLRWLNLLGVGSTVKVIDTPGSEYKDILVEVCEAPILPYLLIGVPDLIRSQFEPQ